MQQLSLVLAGDTGGPAAWPQLAASASRGSYKGGRWADQAQQGAIRPGWQTFGACQGKQLLLAHLFQMVSCLQYALFWWIVPKCKMQVPVNKGMECLSQSVRCIIVTACV